MDPTTRNRTRRHRRHRPRQREGFTLIELLTVIGILSLLLGILAVTATTVRVRTRVQKSQFIINQLVGAIRTYHNDRGEYPPSAEGTSTYTGSELLVQAVTGYRDDDNQPGFGFRDMARGRVFGPYNDTDRLQLSRTSNSPVKFEFLDAFERPILYYRYDSDHGYVAGHNDNGPPDLETYLKGPGNDYFRKDFVLLSPGPDGRYDQIPYIQAASAWNRDCDDVTNFMEQ